MPILNRFRYMNLFHIYFLCVCLALFFPLISNANKSTLFLVPLLALLAAGILRVARSGLYTSALKDMFLWGAPPVICAIFAMARGGYQWSLLPFLVVYVMQAVILGTATGISRRRLELWIATVSVALLLCVPLGIGAIGTTGSFSPFTIFGQNDGSISKNTYGIVLFSMLVFNLFFIKNKYYRGKYLPYIFLLLCVATGSRGLLLTLMYFVGIVFVGLRAKVLIAPLLLIAGVFLAISVDWSAYSDNRLIRLGDTIRQIATQEIRDDGNNDLLRLTIIYSAVAAWKENPIVGLGPGHDKIGVQDNLENVYFASDRITDTIGRKVWGTHNFYLKILVEYGVFCIFIVIYFLRLARRLRKIDPVLFHGFVGVLIFSATNNVPTGLVFFPILFLFQAISFCRDLKTPPRVSPSLPFPSTIYLEKN